MVAAQLPLGVRVLDGLIPCGKGQRLGIFAGSGVGKSSLMSMIARGTAADVSVVALIGERGREVAEFIARDLGPEGLARSVVVVATSDAPAVMRIRAAFTATRIAEWFRDQGNDVVLMMDSVTRFAMAQREVGLAAGEPPATRGYPPSVFGLLPRLLERAGLGEQGSITGLYTVLVEGDDMNEPIADTARSILDGHIQLSRALAESNHYPAVDVLGSISRVAPAVAPPKQLRAGGVVRELLAAWRDAKDLIEIDAYVAGTNPVVDRAVALKPAIDAFCRQPVTEVTTLDGAREALAGLVPAEESSSREGVPLPSGHRGADPGARRARCRGPVHGGAAGPPTRTQSSVRAAEAELGTLEAPQGMTTMAALHLGGGPGRAPGRHGPNLPRERGRGRIGLSRGPPGLGCRRPAVGRARAARRSRSGPGGAVRPCAPKRLSSMTCRRPATGSSGSDGDRRLGRAWPTSSRR